jgi:predicted ATP-grasp superfamily ATP-dependent carboligase
MSAKKTQSEPRSQTGVVVTAETTATALGVIRSFGRRGIPVVYMDSRRHAIARYSRYIGERLKCPSVVESEAGFIDALLDFGRHIDRKMIIIPVGDDEVLALSKYRQDLEPYYHLPVSSHDVVQTLVNKRRFYKLLLEMNIPHPKTYFPESVDDLRYMGREIDYPFVIKPAYSSRFQSEFGRKAFLIGSPSELDRAIGRLMGKNLELVVQEIVPGRQVYAFYSYLNSRSEVLAVCGYDKIRHHPVDFGSGSFCESCWRPDIVEPTIDLLQRLGYCGFAEPELIRDPRDNTYKLLEINARTTLQNRLASACGVDIEYVALLDAEGRYTQDSKSFRGSVLWVDDLADLQSFFTKLKRRELTVAEVLKSLRLGKVHSVFAWDDPVPFLARAADRGLRSLRLLLGK